MNEGLDLIKRQQPEIIDGFPTGNIYIGVTKEELIELEKELKALNVFKELEFFDVRCDNENGKMIYLLVWNAVAICRISEEQYELLKEVLL